MPSLCGVLFETARRVPDRQAVADPGAVWTYEQLRAAVLAVGAAVRQAPRSECVGVLVPNSVGYPAAFYGVSAAGRLPVPLNYLLAPQELKEIVREAGLQVVVATRVFRELAEALAPNVLFVERLLQNGGTIEPAHAGLDDVATVLYTSGTSASPKGVELTHGNLLSCARACTERASLGEQHRFLGVLPLFHSFALSATMILPLSLGASTYFLPRFTPQSTLEAMVRFRASVILGVPSMYGAMCRLKEVDEAELGHLELCVSGGEPLPETIRTAFEQRFGSPLLEGYGLTETSPVVAINVPGLHKPGTVGWPIPGVEFQIVGEDDRPVSAGTHGEIRIRGPVVMRGYRAQPEATAKALSADGWFRTGDLGFLDEDGFLSVTGRKKELIIVAGQNVYPQEIEQVLLRHPAVQAAAAVGEVDPTRGQVPVAYVALGEGAEVDSVALQEFCRVRLAGYKVPRRVVIRPDLPMSPTGKVLKRRLHLD